MALFAFSDITLELTHRGENTASNVGSAVELERLLEDLSWVKMPAAPATEPTLRFSVSRLTNGLRAPPSAHELFRVEGFSALQHADDFYLTDGSSILHLQADQRRGTAHLAPSFFSKPPLIQTNFWAFSLLKLLRPFGFYSLHAAAIVADEGPGLLIVGPSGSGKTTLALGLIRQGWRYLSDDAVILRLQEQKIEALALRKQFYVDAQPATSFPEIPLGEETLDDAGQPRRRVYLEHVYPEQFREQCFPQLLLFSRIVPQTQSNLVSISRIEALKRLLACSGPQLFDKETMNSHLQVLKTLLRQTVAYELWAGQDLYHDPLILMRLLNNSEGHRNGSPRNRADQPL